MEFNYQELFQHSPIGYVCTSKDGTVVEVNKRFLLLVGYEKEEVLGKMKLIDFLTAGSKIYFSTSYSVILDLKGRVDELTFKLKRKDESRLPVLINSNNIFDGENFKYTLTSIVDFSKRSIFEKQLLAAKQYSENLNEELSNLNKEFESFNYIASHDLKNPLSGITLAIEMIEDLLPENEEAASLLQIHKNSVKKLHDTINSLNTSIKIRKSKNHFEPLKIYDILDEVLASFKLQLERLNGSINLNKSNSGFTIVGNKAFVSSILQNVIENSTKYRSNKRKLHIEINSKVDEKYHCIIIRDNGIGIDLEKNGEKLWGLFNRFSNNSSGTGIGMHLIKGMIEQMGGRIEIKSELHQFTEILLYFKLTKDITPS